MSKNCYFGSLSILPFSLIAQTIVGLLFFLLKKKKIIMNGSNGFFTNDFTCDCDFRQQHLADDHFRMSRMEDLDVCPAFRNETFKVIVRFIILYLQKNMNEW